MKRTAWNIPVGFVAAVVVIAIGLAAFSTLTFLQLQQLKGDLGRAKIDLSQARTLASTGGALSVQTSQSLTKLQGRVASLELAATTPSSYASDSDIASLRASVEAINGEVLTIDLCVNSLRSAINDGGYAAECFLGL